MIKLFCQVACDRWVVLPVSLWHQLRSHRRRCGTNINPTRAPCLQCTNTLTFFVMVFQDLDTTVIQPLRSRARERRVTHCPIFTCLFIHQILRGNISPVVQGAASAPLTFWWCAVLHSVPRWVCLLVLRSGNEAEAGTCQRSFWRGKLWRRWTDWDVMFSLDLALLVLGWAFS